jgi:hypothetical protein
MLLEETLKKRGYFDRVLKKYGVDKIDLESCFEKPFPPPPRFLRWLIENPDKMTWGKGKFSKETLLKREKLFGKHGETAAHEARQEAIDELTRYGSEGSQKQWWAFEGFTEVDCCLETDRVVLFIEGKRNDTLASATNWYPERNQIIRNLEVAQEYVRNKNIDFAVMVISEKEIDPILPDVIENSLPHFSPTEREAIMGSYLGFILWEDLCRCVGIDFEPLRRITTEEIVSELR